MGYNRPMLDSKLSRRSAFRTLGGSAVAMTAASYSRVLGANDTIQLGSIGYGDRGAYVLSVFQNTQKVNVGAVCDVYGDRRDKALTKAPGAKGFNDHRQLLEMKQLD